MGPAKLPAPVGARLSKEVGAALQHAETRGKLEELGIQPMQMSPQQFSDFVHSEQKLWSDVIRKANIRLD